jgi:aconitate hydratase A / 2-methylisocitrate dehydratase
MGVIPLEFVDGATRQSLGLTGFETYEIEGLSNTLAPRAMLTVRATGSDGTAKAFQVRSRIDTPEEATYYRNGGILPYVLRNLAKGSARSG